MKNKNIKFEQLPLAVGVDNRTNYFVIVETINEVPVNTYIVCLNNYLFYDEKMRYYVVNQN